MLMVMEDELAFQLVELHVLAVEIRGDVGFPVFGDSSEFFGDVDLVHNVTPKTQWFIANVS